MFAAGTAKFIISYVAKFGELSLQTLVARINKYLEFNDTQDQSLADMIAKNDILS